MTLQSGGSLAGSSKDDPAARIDQLEERFDLLLRVYRRRVQERARAVDAALQPAGYKTLKTLASMGPTNQAVLAEVLGFDKSTLSRQLHQLADLGLVSRTPDAQDGRAAVVCVTPEARARLDEVHADARDTFRARVAAWSPNEVAELNRLLAWLQDAANVG